ncbi:YidC/Oxa1 family membrane protein insertase [bacterium]|nr:YidC/Oxa1 family membrane protein insertase [bacterium]
MFETYFYQPILNLVIFLINVAPGHDLGIAIILLTIIIKLILYPLSRKSLQGQKALQDLQPKINELKKKYKDNKEAMGKAMMALYKENKVNPLSSCLPLLVQMPFLFAVFRVFRNGMENSLDLVYPFIHNPETINYVSLGFIDLSQRNIPIAVLAGLAQFWQSKMMMTKRPQIKTKGAKDEDMTAIMNKQMLYFMPALTVFIGVSFPGGLALYWLMTTLFTGLQQWYIFNKDNKDKKKNELIEGEVVKVNK